MTYLYQMKALLNHGKVLHQTIQIDSNLRKFSYAQHTLCEELWQLCCPLNSQSMSFVCSCSFIILLVHNDFQIHRVLYVCGY